MPSEGMDGTHWGSRGISLTHSHYLTGIKLVATIVAMAAHKSSIWLDGAWDKREPPVPLPRGDIKQAVADAVEREAPAVQLEIADLKERARKNDEFYAGNYDGHLIGTLYNCLRCGWRWHSRKAGLPRCCARCKSGYWDRERGKLARGKRKADRL